MLYKKSPSVWSFVGYVVAGGALVFQYYARPCADGLGGIIAGMCYAAAILTCQIVAITCLGVGICRDLQRQHPWFGILAIVILISELLYATGKFPRFS